MKMCTLMFVVLFWIIKTWNKLKCSSTNNWIKKLIDTLSGRLHCQLKDGIVPLGTKMDESWVDSAKWNK